MFKLRDLIVTYDSRPNSLAYLTNLPSVLFFKIPVEK